MLKHSPFHNAIEDPGMRPEFAELFELRRSVVAQVTRLMMVSRATGPYYADAQGLRRCATVHHGATYRMEELHMGASLLPPHPAHGRISVAVRDRNTLLASVALGHHFGQSDICVDTDGSPVHLFPTQKIAPIKGQLELVRETLTILLRGLEGIERGKGPSSAQRCLLALQSTVPRFN